MTDFNNFDPNNMQEKAEEVAAKADKVVEEAQAEQPQQPQYNQYQQPQQPQYNQYQQPQQPQQPQYNQYQQPQQPQYNPYQPPVPYGYEQKSKLAAGLLGIFLGSLGIHNFYLGFTTKAVIQIVLTICTCGLASIWGFIEGIMIIAGCLNNNCDANGVPLKE